MKFANSNDMGRQAGQKLFGLQAPGFRRMLLMFLAFTYLFVGLAHTISCTGEAVAAVISSDSGNIPDEAPDEGGSKKAHVVGGHCYVCAPVMMPALVTNAEPFRRLAKFPIGSPKFHINDHPRLDTPPPKHLT
jgi:hypothetical protein